MRARGAAVGAAVLSLLGACRRGATPPSSGSAETRDAPAPSVAAAVGRCRTEAPQLLLPGEDTIVGGAVWMGDRLVLGVARNKGKLRLASLVYAPRELASSRVVELGVMGPDDPPPAVFKGPAGVIAGVYVRKERGEPAAAAPARATPVRELRLVRVDETPGGVVASVTRRLDDSDSYDVAFPVGGATGAAAPLLIWDEGSPVGLDVRRAGGAPMRGVVKVQRIGDPVKAETVSPESSDAEAPRLLARPSGFWAAWLSRKLDADEPAAQHEGPAERRTVRWIEVVALDARGVPTSPVRRVGPSTGRATAFELVRVPGAEAKVAVVVQDDAAPRDGAGGRIVRYVVDGDRLDAVEIAPSGVGSALASFSPTDDAALAGWLSWTDVAERGHLTPLAAALESPSIPTAEPTLDGARLVASAAGGALYAVGAATANEESGGVNVRRLSCR